MVFFETTEPKSVFVFGGKDVGASERKNQSKTESWIFHILLFELQLILVINKTDLLVTIFIFYMAAVLDKNTYYL